VLVLPEGLVLPDPAVRARVARLLRGVLVLRLRGVLVLRLRGVLVLRLREGLDLRRLLVLSRQSCSAAMARTSR
jgi:hypothetical protein